MVGIARQYSQEVIHYLRRSLGFAQNGQQLLVGTIPAGSVILKPISGVAVGQVFNAGTANVLDIGFSNASSTDDDFWGTDLSLTALNFVPLDELVSYRVTVDTDIIATLGLTGTAATTGQAEVLIGFIPFSNDNLNS